MVVTRVKTPLKRPPPRTFTRQMAEKLKEDPSLDSPLALYQWFVGQCGRPLSGERLRQAYLAAWAVAIDKGMVHL